MCFATFLSCDSVFDNNLKRVWDFHHVDIFEACICFSGVGIRRVHSRS